MFDKIYYLLFILLCVGCRTLDKNVLIFNQLGQNAPCEPSIAISPINTDHIIAGSVLKNVHISLDGGKTWKTKEMHSSQGIYGDPVIVADHKGAFYYAHLGDPDQAGWSSSRILESIVVQRSDDQGKTWTDGVAVGQHPPKDQDKEWLATDQYSDAIYMTWTEFDEYNSPDPNHHTRILFTVSHDQGANWSTPISISMREGDCVDDDNTVEGAVPVAGKNGRVFVSWAGHEKIYFNRSADYGKTWLDEEIVVAEQAGGWVFPIQGNERVNGMPVISVDHSDGSHDGRIYVLFSDQREGVTNTNIYIIHSDDNGDSWSKTQLVNQDKNQRHQYFPWITIDQSSGFLYVVFYDQDQHPDLKNDVSISSSYDGGQTWQQRIISNKSFETPPQFVFFGDYNNISAVNGIIRPIWTRYEKGKLSIWTALIKEKTGAK